MIRHVVIIGGGASGMAAAIAAAEGGVSVTLMEKKEQLGKKLQVTGNGHCNFSNTDMGLSYYHCDDEGLLSSVLEAYPTERIRSFFESLGMLSHEKNGYCYPLSDQAATVTFVLKERLKELGVRVLLNTDAKSVRKLSDGRFEVQAGEQVFFADSVVLSCGSEASVKDKRPFAAYRILQSFGLKTEEVFPSLVPLFGNEGCEAFWEGVRYTCGLRLPSGSQETGEVQFTKKGISGIPVFQLSHEAVEAIRKKGKTIIRIDFFPGLSKEEVFCALTRNPERRLDRVLSGMFPAKLGPVTAKKAGFSASRRIIEYSNTEMKSLLKTLKSYEYEVCGFGGIEDSQVSSGGLSLKEIASDCEVRSVPGLYVTGELLNADGICGGYNLHFAFATGLSAGRAIAEKAASENVSAAEAES